jgi:hypothetical protein
VIFRCFDLETTSIDVESTVVVQAAIVDADTESWPVGRVTHTQLFAARDVPVAATRIHRITDREPERFDFPVTVIPADAPSFGECVQSMTHALTELDVVAVSFNGCGYDIPIIARYAAATSSVMFNGVSTREQYETRLRRRHIDVMRLWARARSMAIEAPWSSECRGVDESGVQWLVPRLTADMFAGGLTPAHGFWLGRGFDSAHDAAVDCHATLDVLRAMLVSGFVDVETAIRWSNEPLPGDVDFDGKFKWEGDQAVIAFGKHSGTPLESLPASYLRWMLDSDFPASTKALVRLFTQGSYPVRAYENEVNHG